MIDDGTFNLPVGIARVHAALVRAQSFEEVLGVREMAEGLRAFVKAAKRGLDQYNRAAELRLRAERRAGEMLVQMSLRGGDRRSKRQMPGISLEELGITSDESSRWQGLARVPDEVFERYVTTAGLLGEEISAKGLLRFAKAEEASRQCEPLQSPPPELKRVAVGDDALLRKELLEQMDVLEAVLRNLVQRSAVALSPGEIRTAVGVLVDMRETLNAISHKGD